MLAKGLYCTFLLASLVFFSIEIPKRAFKFYEKGELDKAVNALEKSLAKDTLNPAARYLYSVMYVDTAFWGYHVDTAFYHINQAIRDFEYVTEAKDFVALKEVGVDSTSLAVHKDKVDSLSFQLVRQKHQIAQYNWFIETHYDAFQVPEAIRFRNHIAFEQAEAAHTYQSYLGFMKAYPGSVDFKEAEKRYQRLLFETLTADGKLKSYVDFLEEYPATPYRDTAEAKIFEISTATNTVKAYTDFLRKYPNDKIKQRIISRIYHLYKTLKGSDSFFQFFDFTSKRDSLQQIIALEKGYWLPKFENGQYSFINSSGMEMLRTGLKNIPEDYLCNPIHTDFLLVGGDSLFHIIGRNGKPISNLKVKMAEDLGFGYIKVVTERGTALIHKSGEVILGSNPGDIALLNQHFIKFKKDSLWGLTTIHQRIVSAPIYDAIDTLGRFILFEKGGQLGLVAATSLFPTIDGGSVTIELPYEAVELLENGLFWILKNGEEAVLDARLNVVIPFEGREIHERPYGWILKNGQQVQLIHQDYFSLQDSTYESIVENEKWVGLQKNGKWTLLDQKGGLFPSYDYDSLWFLGENTVMLQKNEKLVAQFKNGKQLLIEEGWTPKLLVPQTYIKTGEKAVSDFLMLSNEKGFRRVYNSSGREILGASYKSVTALGPNLLKLQKKNAALVDGNGQFILNFIYNGIGSYDNGYVSILKNNKVGILNVEKKTIIPPTYQNRVIPYNDGFLVASKGGFKGFIDTKNTERSPFEFDEVKYWTDEVALVRIEEEWLLHRLADEEIVYEGIEAFDFLSDTPEEKVIRIKTGRGKGIYSSKSGEVIEPTYYEVMMLGTKENPVFFAEKYIEEANLHVVLYFDKNGNKLFTQTFQEEDYFHIVCRE